MGEASRAPAREVEGTPSTIPLLAKAALPALPGVGALPGVRRTATDLPDLTLVRRDVGIDPDHVAACAAVCGFAPKETLPLTYPHMLAFGLHLAIMTDPSFPYPPVGTVHVENTITRHREIHPSERLEVTARPDGLRPHPKGTLFDIETTVRSGEEVVWEETTTLLRRGARHEDAPRSRMDDLEVVPGGGMRWKLGADLGRRYAAVSGDRNPIHLYPLTAKAFGFPRQIAHGMWSKARCVASLEGRLPAAVRVDAAFKKPVLLPGTVAFGARRVPGDGPGSAAHGGYRFALTRPRDGAPHLLGRSVAV